MKSTKRQKLPAREGSRAAATAIRKTVLSEGVRVVTERIPHVRSVAIGFWIEVGTRDEMPEINGISHFVEHMLFKGTKRRSAAEIARTIEDGGGTLNAFTGKELTCFYAHVLDSDLPLAVDVLSDMLTESVFDPTEVEKEIAVIQDEIRAAEEVPEDRIFERFYRDLFGEHPLARPTLGTRETVSHFSREAAQQYMAQHYTCNRLVVAASGNVDHDALCQMLSGRFQHWPRKSDRLFDPLPPLQPGAREVAQSILQAHVCLGNRALRYTDERRYAALILNTLLGGGMSSRLFQNIREKHGICYAIDSYLDFLFDTGVFCIYANTDRDKLEKALELIHQELEQLRAQPISPEELERTKRRLRGSLLLGLENTANRMSRLAKMEIYFHNHYSLDEIIEGLDAVTCDSVWEIAQLLLNSEQLVTTILRPE